MRKRTYRPPALPRDPFAYIAFWQLMTFLLLILLVWFSELRDAPQLFFGQKASPPNYFRAFIITSAVLFTAILTVGNTYIQAKRVINSLVSVCSKCHKVRIHNDTWKQIEEYLGETSMLNFTHGLCPDCKDLMMEEIERHTEAKQARENDRH
ncbi:MAG: hypothetical protein GX811_09650 [Lentisphaerae bacterium]|nr:hypothetical protein [Lentisphaerota bacterium]